MRTLGMFRIEIVLALVLGGLALWHLGGAAYIHTKAVLAQHLLERAWSKSESVNSRMTPWPWADTWPVAKLEVPRIKTSWMVLSDATGRSLAFGPGVLKQEALRRAGSTIVISGHRDTHFAALRELQVGDELKLQLPDKSARTYRVTNLRVIDLKKERLLVDSDHSELILTTCFPFEAVDPGGWLRYLVFAMPEREKNDASVKI